MTVLRPGPRLALLAAAVALVVVMLGLGAAAQRAEAQESLQRIRGTILGPDGEPLGGIAVRAWTKPLSERPSAQATSSNGAWELEVPDGSYFLEFIAVIEGQECSLGWAGLDGKHSFALGAFRPARDQRVVIEGAGIDGINVSLPRTPADLCQVFGGIATDETGEPLTNTPVGVGGVGVLLWNGDTTTTTSSGSFSFRGPNGFYEFSVYTTGGSTCTVTGVENPHPGGSHGVVAVGANAASLRLVVSGAVTPTSDWLTCWFPHETVTTELRPGWNLAGWTGADTEVSVIFDTIPALEAAYSWDAGTRSFRKAARKGATGPESLSTLQTGMGLWLYLGGEEAFTWSRPRLPGSGLVALLEGWNLVAWSGEDALGVEDAVASLGAELRAAGTWDPVAGGFDLYSPVAPPHAASPWRVTRGEAVWVNVSRARRWYQPGSFQPPLHYADEVSADTRVWLASATQSVVGYFAQRMGVIALPVRFYVGDLGHCGFFAHPAVVVTEDCVEAITHEYAHAIQYQLAGRGGNAAGWFTEGVAERWLGQYQEHVGDRTYGEWRDSRLLPETRRTETPLAQMDASGQLVYAVANLAVDWLMQLAGEDSILEYYRQRFSHPTWEEAFEKVFGIGVDEFHNSFEQYRGEVAPPLPAIEGVVTGSDGEPASRLEIGAWVHGGSGASAHAWTAADGSFRLPLVEGTYSLQVVSDRYHLCTVFGPEIPEGAARATLSIVDGGPSTEDGAPSSIRIVLSAPVSREQATWIPCYFDVPIHWVAGILIGSDGEPAAGVEIGAWPRGGSERGPHVWTAADGSFRIPLVDGTYSLQVLSGAFSACTVSGHDGSTAGASAHIRVAGKDVTGLQLTGGGKPPDRETWSWCTLAE